MQTVQAAARRAVGYGVTAEAEFQELPPRGHTMLTASQFGHRQVQPTRLHPVGHRPRGCRRAGHGTTVSPATLRVTRGGARVCGGYGPGVRSTAASAVAASASRIAAPSRALER